jgi:hypothetical protein
LARRSRCDAVLPGERDELTAGIDETGIPYTVERFELYEGA